jgi:hypothetical protein
MTAFNVVRFRVKPGEDQAFLAAHSKIGADWEGLRHVNMVKTGDRTYCIIAEWGLYGCTGQRSFEHDQDARYIPPHT